MYNRSFAAFMLLLFVVGCALPTNSYAKKRTKCEKAIQKAEKRCHCTLTATPAKETRDAKGRRIKKEKGGRQYGNQTRSYVPKQGLTWKQPYFEVDSTMDPPTVDTGFIITIVNWDDDTTTLDIMGTDTSKTLRTSTFVVTENGDTIRRQPSDFVPEEEQADTTEQRSDEKFETKHTMTGTDTVVVGGMQIPAKKYFRKGSKEGNTEPFIWQIFKSCSGVNEVEILDLPGDDPQHRKHLIVLTGQYDQFEVYKTILRWSRIVQKKPRE